MPRRRPDGRVPSWSRLCRLAATQCGYFTGAQALEVGFSPQLLQYYIQKSLIRRVCRGIFHLGQHPRAEHEALIALWLWSRKEGIFSHETALTLLGLAQEQECSRLTLTLPPSWRRRRLRLPLASTVYYAEVPAEDTCRRGPLPFTAPLRTLVDCVQAGVDPDLLERATRNAVRQRLLTRAGLDRALRRAMPSSPPRSSPPPPARLRTCL
ncbi:MAG: hypothetical protein RMK29_01145 [Myxococcales bacterium]|nr:hypothetical protein [Myxococcota bacterium]MDW8280283.1 hypothetical protein [Myxococcales bacterium]